MFLPSVGNTTLWVGPYPTLAVEFHQNKMTYVSLKIHRSFVIPNFSRLEKRFILMFNNGCTVFFCIADFVFFAEDLQVIKGEIFNIVA